MLQTMIADFQQHFWLYVSIPFQGGRHPDDVFTT